MTDKILFVMRHVITSPDDRIDNERFIIPVKSRNLGAPGALIRKGRGHVQFAV